MGELRPTVAKFFQGIIRPVIPCGMPLSALKKFNQESRDFDEGSESLGVMI